MRTTTIPHLLASAFLLISIAGCGSSSDSKQTINCSIPCLGAAPGLDINTISAATGGTVKLSFTLSGDITNVSNVVVFLSSTDFFSGNTTTAGVATLLNPAQAENTVEIVVDAGTPADTYYPWISITANSPTNSGNQYYLDPTKSNARYTYVEVVEGSSSTPALTGYAIPKVTIQ